MRTRSRLLFQIKRGLAWFGTILVVLVALGVAYQTIATSLATRNGSPQGQLYTVNGRQIHLVCIGEGNPAVVLQAGGSAESLWWYWVQHQLAAHTRVCAYDRPGHGWSEPAADPRDALTIVNELHTLLQQAGIPAPYVMAGHSFGALWTRVYVAQYPDEVTGAVLVDSTFLIPEAYASQREFDDWKRSNDVLKILEWAAYRTGLVRLAALGEFQHSGYPPNIADELAVLRSPNKVFDADYAEQVASRWAFTKAVAAAENLGGRPLAVLWASRSATAQDYFRTRREETAAFSTNSVTRVIQGADHGSILGNEQFARQVSAAILDVMQSTKTGQPLAR